MPRGPRLRQPPRAPLPTAPRPGAVALGGLLLGGAALTGCAGPLTVQPGPEAAEPACTGLLEALPRTVAGAAARQTTGTGTAAWGDPAVLLRCGVTPTGPTTRECVTVEGPDGSAVDWVLLASGPAGAILTTYGRSPAVEVEVPAAYGPATLSVLPDLGPAVAALPSEAVCVS